MKKILVLGAGRSTDALIHYLDSRSSSLSVQLTLADAEARVLEKKIKNYSSAVQSLLLNANDAEALQKAIAGHDMVISMLPAFMHPAVAKHCLELKKHLFTASYVSPEMNAMDKEARKHHVLFLNECGLDPGIDHLSVMKALHEIREKNGKVYSFRSWCGGLVAKESNDNPWGYKFSWNPRNVILAGKGTAVYRMNGQLRFTPYHRLFKEHFMVSDTKGEKFDGYPNRNSLLYETIYGLKGIPTFIRGTLRYPGFCKGWHILIDAGLTDDSSLLPKELSLSLHDLTKACLGIESGKNLRDELQSRYADIWSSDIEKKLEYIGIIGTKEPVPGNPSTLADALQNVLEEKWKLKQGDKDRVVMIHETEYHDETGKKIRRISSLDLNGMDENHTAMALTVGLPLAIAVRLFIENKVKDEGVVIPVDKKWYEPILSELEKHHIRFNEKEEEITG
jgi:saccharopine dehydrogenase (NADP+, L-glutamate forming)